MRPRYLFVCLWRRLLASRRCSFGPSGGGTPPSSYGVRPFYYIPAPPPPQVPAAFPVAREWVLLRPLFDGPMGPGLAHCVPGPPLAASSRCIRLVPCSPASPTAPPVDWTALGTAPSGPQGMRLTGAAEGQPRCSGRACLHAATTEVRVVLPSAAGGAHWPLADSPRPSSGPSPFVGGGAHRPLTPSVPPWPIPPFLHSLPFPWVAVPTEPLDCVEGGGRGRGLSQPLLSAPNRVPTDS